MCSVDVKRQLSKGTLNTGCEVSCVPLSHRSGKRSISTLGSLCVSTSTLSGFSIKPFRSLQRISCLFLFGEYYFKVIVNEMGFFFYHQLSNYHITSGVQGAGVAACSQIATLLNVHLGSDWLSFISSVNNNDFFQICFSIPHSLCISVYYFTMWPLAPGVVRAHDVCGLFAFDVRGMALLCSFFFFLSYVSAGMWLMHGIYRV